MRKKTAHTSDYYESDYYIVQTEVDNDEEYYFRQLRENEDYYNCSVEDNNDSNEVEKDFLIEEEFFYEEADSSINEEEKEEKLYQELIFDKANEYALLSEDEEKKLFERLKEGDLNAKETVVCSNIRLVLSIIRKYKNKGLKYDELLSVGMEALVDSVEKFDVTFENKFSSYATPKISGRIKSELSKNTGRGIFSDYMVNQILKLNRITAGFEKENGRLPSDEELSELMGNEVKTIIEYKKNAEVLSTLSLDSTVGLEEGTRTLGDTISKQKAPNNDKAELYRRETIMALLFLTDREKYVLFNLSGVMGYEKKSYKQLAEMIGVGVERVKEIERNAKLRLEHELRKGGIISTNSGHIRTVRRE